MQSSEVIDWQEALQQTGEDEEFLRELLEDLRSETLTQVQKIEEIIQNPTDQPFTRIMRAAHVIKGASSNLMCSELRSTSMALEQAAQVASTENNGQPSAQTLQTVQACYLELKKAVDNFTAYCTSIGV